MYRGKPIVIAKNGLGIPVAITNSGVPVRVANNGIGMPVVIADQGEPVTIIDYDQPPQPPSDPKEFHVPEIDGLDDFETEYDAHTGNIMVRLFARCNGNVKPILRAYWDGVELDNIYQWSIGGVDGGPVVFIAAIDSGAIGKKKLQIKTIQGSCGVSAIRLAEAPEVSHGPRGDADGWGSSHQTASGVGYGLYKSTPNTMFFHVSGFCTPYAHPISINTQAGDAEAAKDIKIQWQTWVDGGNGIATSAVFCSGVTSDGTRTFFSNRANISSRNFAGASCEVFGLPPTGA